MTLLKPVWVQPTGADPSLYYPGSELRQFAQALVGAEGVFGFGSLVVAQRAAGANFSVDIAAGQASVVGNDVAGQGIYVITNTAGAYNLVTPSAPGAGTRYHRVVAQIRDKTCNGSWTTYDWIPVLVQDTGSGLPAEPPSAVSLAQVAITTGQVSVLNANITDLRPIIPQLGIWDSWHPLSLQNSWSNTGGGSVTAQYRRSSLNEIEVVGNITHASTSGTSVFASSLTAGYLPLSQQCRAVEKVIATNQFASSISGPFVILPIGGNIQFQYLPAGTTQVEFYCTFCLDA